MIKLTEGGFADIWAGEKAPDTLAISYALQMQVIRIVEAAEKTKCFSGIDQLNEDTLDHLAIELRSVYYDQELPIETKRSIIKNTLIWYAKGGTAAAVTELIKTIFGSGGLEEWFVYGGDPFHFRAVLPDEMGSDVLNITKFREMIERVQNARSHLDELMLEEPITLKLIVTDGTYRVNPPLCGTINTMDIPS